MLSKKYFITYVKISSTINENIFIKFKYLVEGLLCCGQFKVI